MHNSICKKGWAVLGTREVWIKQEEKFKLSGLFVQHGELTTAFDNAIVIAANLLSGNGKKIAVVSHFKMIFKRGLFKNKQTNK